MSPEGGYFADLNDLPAWTQYTLAANSLVSSLKFDDPEDTLMVQLTFSEVATITMGLMVLGRVFPDLVGLCASLSEKLKEVSTAQEFLGKPRTLDEE